MYLRASVTIKTTIRNLTIYFIREADKVEKSVENTIYTICSTRKVRKLTSKPFPSHDSEWIFLQQQKKSHFVSPL